MLHQLGRQLARWRGVEQQRNAVLVCEAGDLLHYSEGNFELGQNDPGVEQVCLGTYLYQPD